MSKLFTKLSAAALLAISIGAYAQQDGVSIENEDGSESVLPPSKTVATNGTVKFIGNVVNNTCSISTADRNKTVTLDKVTINELKKGVTKKKPFNITLEDCPRSPYIVEGGKKTHVTLTFNGTGNPQVTQEGHLRNHPDTAGLFQYAENVEIKVLNKDQTLINLLADTASQAKLIKQPFNLETDRIQFDFYAEYVAKERATPGLINASVPFQIDYQ